MKNSISIILILLSLYCNAQTYVRYKDKESKKWGYKNTITNQPICEPIFDKAFEFNDSLALVFIDNVTGIIDTNGNVVYPEEFTDIFYYSKYDTLSLKTNLNYKKDSFAIFGAIEDQIITPRLFMVNSKCECVYHKYFPCPIGITTNFTNYPESYKLLNKCEYECINKNYERMFEYANYAFQLDSTNPILYLFISELIYVYGLDIYKDSLKLYIDKAEKITKPNSFEERYLLEMQYQYYEYFDMLNNRFKEIPKEFVKKKYGTFGYSSFTFLIGYNHGIGDYLSIGLGRSIGEKYSNMFNLNYFFGFSFIRGIENNISALKLNMLHIYYPLSVGLYPILFYNDKNLNLSVGLKPEIGISLYNTVITYGYTFVSRSKFVNERTHSINLYFYLNTFRENIYLDYYY